MAFEKTLWTKTERDNKLKRQIVIALIAVLVLVSVGIVVYIKKTNVDTISTTKGLKTLEKLENSDLVEIENAIEDRRNGRDEKDSVE